MIQNFNIFNQNETPMITLCNPDMETLFVIDRIIYDTKISVKYNAISTFSFKIPKVLNGVTVESYLYFESKRLIFIEDIGYFIISKIEENMEGLTPVFSIQCQSIESELIYKKIQNIRIESATIEQLLDKLFLNYIQNWSYTKGDDGLKIQIPQDLKYLYRTFEISDKNIYTFLTDEVQKAYGCIIIFNRTDRTLYIVSPSAVLNNNDINIYLSYENLIKSSTFTEYTEEIATALRCYGGNKLDISRANPLGNNLIYNFNYYKNSEWMSENLIAKLNQWSIALSKEEETASDSYLYLIKDNSENCLYYYCQKLAPYEVAISNRTSEIERYDFLLSLVEGDTDESNLLRAYYYTNSNFLKNSYSSAVITTTTNNPYRTVIGEVIPEEYQITLDLIYEWESYKSINYTKQLPTYLLLKEKIEIINNNIFKNKTKYSSKVLLISEAYSAIDNYNVDLTEMEYLYATQEGNLSSVMGEDNPENKHIKKKHDYKTNMLFLKTSVIGDPIPSHNLPDNNKYYLLRDDTGMEEGEVVLTNILITGGINEVNVLIKSENLFIENLLLIMGEINDYLKLETFIGEYYNELLPLVIENSFQNSSLEITDAMFEDDIITASQSLLDQSKIILEKISTPRYEFSITLNNFLNLIEYKDNFTKNLELGNIVHIEIKDEIISAVLLEIKFSFDSPESLELIFSNRLRLDNGNFQYVDVFGKFLDINQDVSFNNLNWNNWSDYRGDVSTFIESALDTSRNEIYSSIDEEIKIGDYGIRGKKKISENSYSSEEIWIASDTIAFTQDNWETTSLALGQTILPNGAESYGIIGESIIGNLLLGNELTISNKVTSTGEIDDSYENLFKISGNEILMRSNSPNNKGIIMSSVNGKSGIIINPLDGFRLGEISGDRIINPSVYIGDDGTLKLNKDTSEFVKYSQGIGKWSFGNISSVPEASYGMYYMSDDKQIENFIYTQKNNNFTGTSNENLILKLANGNFTMNIDGTIKIGNKEEGSMIINPNGKIEFSQTLSAQSEELFEVFSIKSTRVTARFYEVAGDKGENGFFWAPGMVYKTDDLSRQNPDIAYSYVNTKFFVTNGLITDYEDAPE